MKLSPFYYPTTIVCVDDDNLFLRTLSQFLKESSLISCFNAPKNAVSFFQKYTPILPKIDFLRGCLETDKYDMLKHMPVDLNASSLKELRNNELRHSEVSVLITDYNMPEMNGIDLCRELRELPMKKILLTGEADYQQAVAAFNEGIIDSFVRKDSPTIADDIFFQIQKLTKEYFIENTKRLLSHLETDYLLPLSDPKFIAFFNEWCKKHHICEYYLIDKVGNFLLIDEQGNKSYFIVHTDRTLNNFIELHGDDEDAIDFIRAVKSREKVPFFGEGTEGWELALKQWAGCFYSPEILVGAEKYYWAVAA